MSPAPRKNGSSSNSQAFWKTAHFKETTRSLVKKSAPFLLTALAGYVEHKWHEQEEEGQKQEDDKELEREKRKDREKEIERRASVESLRRQVDRLKRKIRRGGDGGNDKGKGKQKARLSPESTESSGLLTRSNPDPDTEVEVEAEARVVEETTRKEIPRHHERRTIPRERSQPREQYFQRPAYRESLPSERYFSETTRITIKDEDRRKPLWEQQREDYFNRKQTTTTTSSPRILPIIPPPRVPTPPISFPEPIPISLEKEKQKKLERQSFDLHHRKSREWELKEIIEQAPKRPIHRHHHRYSTGSKPTSTTTPGLSSEAMENAGRVAALAGFIEAVHIGDTDGDWIGEKGVRVATAAAGSAAVSYGRDRIFGDGGAKDGKDGRGGGKGGRDWKWRNGRWVDGGVRRDERRESCLEGEIRRGSEVLGDVGAGLLVSRLVLGSSHPVVEEDRRGTKRGRRWSYCY